MSTTLPPPGSRWRCAQCGNLTRFDVTRTRQANEFWHFDLGGQPTVEEVEVLAETVEQVRCRWCGSERIELVERPDGG